MVKKYDVFEYMYSKGGPFRPEEIANAFKKSSISYHGIYNILLDLRRLKLIAKNEYGFQAKRNEKNDLLYKMIKFCLKNDINYNDFLDSKIAAFISETFLKKRITAKEVDIDQRTFSKYTGILEKSGFLIPISRKPFTATIPYNTFLRDLTAYFGKKVLVAKAKQDEYLEEIGKEIIRFNKLRSRNEARYRRIANECEIKFIQHSLSIEGNPITLPDTIKLLKERIVPSEYSTESILELQNYQNAISQMNKDAEEGKPLTKESILNYHRIAMLHRADIAGKIRVRPVVIRGNPDYGTANAKSIEPRLDSLINKYNQFISRKKNSLKDILDFAAYFHNEFQHIHPFEDGNSRTTRLIAFHILRTQNIPILDIPLGLLESYIFSTKGAKKRDDKSLNQVLQQIVLYNLKIMDEKLS